MRKPKGPIIVLGPAKTGKTRMLISLSKLGKIAAALTDGGEEDPYLDADVEHEIFAPQDYVNYSKWLDAQIKRSDIVGVVTDHLSGGTTSPGVSEMAMRDALKIHGTTNPMDLPHGQGFFGHQLNLMQVLQTMQVIALNKICACSCLAKMRESENDPKATGEGEDKLMPSIYGSIRQDISASFSMVLYTFVAGFGKGTQYLVTAVPDKVRPAGSRLEFKENINAARMPNDFEVVLNGLQ